MADYKIGQPEPTLAGFRTSSYSGPEEPFFDAGAEVVDIDVPYTLTAALDLPTYAVVNYDRETETIKAATVTAGVSDANAVLGMPLKGAVGETGRVGIHTSGHWNTRVLVYDASFTTDSLKEGAFEAAGRPMLRASTPKFSNDAIKIPN